jgi:undecaprenyl-diphosphatase
MPLANLPATKDFQDASSKRIVAVVIGAAALIAFITFVVHNRLFFWGDHSLATFFNLPAQRSWAADRLMLFISDSVLIKSFPAVAVLFYAWSQSKGALPSGALSEKRKVLLYILCIMPFAIVLARVLAKLSPFRIRPVQNLDLHLRLAYSFDPLDLPHWSSFLSDHAVFFFALATGVALVNRRAGLFLYLHTLIIIVLPRLYLGIHYPSDLLSGAAFGFAFGYLANWSALRSLVAFPGARLYQYSQGVFYAAFFYVSAETGSLYEHLIAVAVHAAQAVQGILHHFKHHL